MFVLATSLIMELMHRSFILKYNLWTVKTFRCHPITISSLIFGLISICFDFAASRLACLQTSVFSKTQCLRKKPLKNVDRLLAAGHYSLVTRCSQSNCSVSKTRNPSDNNDFTPAFDSFLSGIF